MRVLVTAASKYGATSEIARAIARSLEGAGLEVEVMPPDAVRSLDGYDAVVLGSAVYVGRWLQSATDLAQRQATALAIRPVWLFSSGPIGSPDPKPKEEPEGIADLVATIDARDHRIFTGRIERKRLRFGDRAVVAALRVPEGDFRDWEQISAWAAGIAQALGRHPQARS